MEKYTFDHLNSFVEGRLVELHEDEARFRLQVLGLQEIIDEGLKSKIKLDNIYRGLISLNWLQQCIDYTLDSIQALQMKWANILTDLESKFLCQCYMETTCSDVQRNIIFQNVSQLFATLTNYKDAIDDVNQKTITYDESQKQESIYLLFRAIDIHLRHLENLYFHTEKLQTLVSYAEHIRNAIIFRYQCPQPNWPLCVPTSPK